MLPWISHVPSPLAKYKSIQSIEDLGRLGVNLLACSQNTESIKWEHANFAVAEDLVVTPLSSMGDVANRTPRFVISGIWKLCDTVFQRFSLLESGVFDRCRDEGRSLALRYFLLLKYPFINVSLVTILVDRNMIIVWCDSARPLKELSPDQIPDIYNLMSVKLNAPNGMLK
jgi:hypothetical protein